jgi:hypothetical protein
MTNACLFGSHLPNRQVGPLGLKMQRLWIAFSEPPSGPTWLENAASLVAFSEPPSGPTWLENALGHPP